MEAPYSAGISAAPGEHDYAGETQGATQQASQNFYANDVHPMDRPFFGCLYPCNSELHRIDFVRTNPIVKIGRGPNNDVIMLGMRISAKPFPSFPSHFFPCSRSVCPRVLGIQVLIIARSNGMDARIAGPMSSCTTTRPTALGYVSFAPAPPSLIPPTPHGVKNAHTHALTHAHTPRTQINNARVAKGESCILRDGNEIAFGSPMQQQKLDEDYRFIYRHLVPKELTSIDAKYDMAHELGRGTFATVMKAIARNTGEWWAVKIIHMQMLRPSNSNNNNENDGAAAIAALPPRQRTSSERSTFWRSSIIQIFVTFARRSHQTKVAMIIVRLFFLNL